MLTLALSIRREDMVLSTSEGITSWLFMPIGAADKSEVFAWTYNKLYAELISCQ
jgi:hypothetical protein